MDNSQFRTLLQRFLNGQANETEEGLVEYWYRSFDHDPGPGAARSAQDKALVWSAIRAEIGLDRNKRRRMVYWWSAAAVVVMVLAVGLIYRSLVPIQPVYTWQEFRSGTGEVKTIELPDSSRITMNARTCIAVRMPFNGSQRRIELKEGEAYFEVIHDPARPFMVQSGRVTTQVLGTAFNIHAYAHSSRLSILLASGRVGILYPGKSTRFLSPGQQLSVDRATGAGILSEANAYSYLRWRNHQYFLQNADLDEIAHLFEAQYGLHLKTGNPVVKKYRFTVPVDLNYPAEDMLRRIFRIHHNTFKKEADTVNIY